MVLATALLVATALIFQATIFSNDLKGELGFAIVDILQQVIGLFGVWIFMIALLAFSLIILCEPDFEVIFSKLKKSTAQKEEPKKEELQTETMPSKELVDELEHPTVEIVEEVVKEEVAQEIVEQSVEVQEEKIEHILQTKEQPQQEIIPEEKELVNNSAFIIEEDDIQELPTVVHVEENPPFEKLNIVEKAVHVQESELQKVEILSELEENKILLEQMEKGERVKPVDFVLPSLDLLNDAPPRSLQVSESEIDQKISDLLEKLRRFKIDGDVVRTYTGPVVTTFEFKPAPHIKVSKILTLQDDLAMALKAQTIRIQAPVPGKDVVGIEIPNRQIETIYLKDVLKSDVFQDSSSPLTIALGKDIVGNPFVTDLRRLPHLLIAGTTGSGKSVGINSMLLSLLYRNSPDMLRIIMIDPKQLEFLIYDGIPHLLAPVITEAKQAVVALANMTEEMTRRNKLMSHARAKNIESYNEKAKEQGLTPLPYILVIIDELADLMMTSGKEVEYHIARLAQMARAAGIHLIVATQRPSVDVVTGLIKANLPSRISYKVGQKVDSKVIIDAMGAESLLGRGDLLFTPPSSSGLIRLHAPFATEKEIENIVDYLKDQREVEYDASFLKEKTTGGDGAGFSDDEIDDLFEEAKNIVLTEQKTSISYIQRKLQIGYNRAARIVEQLEAMGILSAPNSKGQREILN